MQVVIFADVFYAIIDCYFSLCPIRIVRFYQLEYLVFFFYMICEKIY